jgi:hypothetical protein
MVKGQFRGGDAVASAQSFLQAAGDITMRVYGANNNRSETLTQRYQ